MNRFRPRNDAGFTSENAAPPRIAASGAAVDAFLRDLGQIGLPAQCIAFTVDVFRYRDRVEREAGSFFDILRRYFIERASTRDTRLSILIRCSWLGIERQSSDANLRMTLTGNANGHRVAAEALRSSRLLNSDCHFDFRGPTPQAVRRDSKFLSSGQPVMLVKAFSPSMI